MKVNELFELNLQRCNRWHTKGGIAEWSALEWAGAMCGEAGEAANVAKKVLRLEHHIASINQDHMEDAVSELHGATTERRHFIDMADANRAVAKEVADTIIYGLLLMARVGVTDPESVIREVFNRKSEEYGFPELLP